MSNHVKEYIKRLQDAYYSGDPIVSNEEYDALVSRFGEESLGTGGRFKHFYRMYSQQKVYPGRGDKYPVNISECIESPKLDGCAVAVLYVDGKLVGAHTRGDGITSPTFISTEKLKLLDVPETALNGVVQVTGEVVTTKRVENERNFASGAVQLEDMQTYSSRVSEGGLIFVAYNVQCTEECFGVYATYTEDMDYLSSIGFSTVTESNWMCCPQDGIVYRINDNATYTSLGTTDKFPRGAFAVKEDNEGVQTTLREIVWNTGKTGKVTPTAIFDPVVIDDATISRATLNNVGYIEALDLELGDAIIVIRSGGIIPKIIGKV